MIRKLFLASFLFLLFFTWPENVKAQETAACEFKIEAIDIRGIHLGMKITEVKALCGSSYLQTPLDPVTKVTTLQYLIFEDKEKFRGLSKIHFGFLDGSLISIFAYYDSSVRWKGVEEFTDKLSQAWSLKTPWVKTKSYRMGIICTDVLIVAELQVTPEISIVDRKGLELIQRRQDDEKKREKQDFKP